MSNVTYSLKETEKKKKKKKLRKVKIITVEFLAAGEAFLATFWLTLIPTILALNEITFYGPAFSTEKTLISVPAVPQLRDFRYVSVLQIWVWVKTQ